MRILNGTFPSRHRIILKFRRVTIISCEITCQQSLCGALPVKNVLLRYLSKTSIYVLIKIYRQWSKQLGPPWKLNNTRWDSPLNFLVCLIWWNQINSRISGLTQCTKNEEIVLYRTVCSEKNMLHQTLTVYSIVLLHHFRNVW